MILDAIVVDDEPIARRRLVRMLADYSESIQIVAEASDGRDALRSITKHTPHVLFLDLQMPELDGFSLLRQLEPQPWIVFTTAHEEFALDAFRENAIDYLLKPISAADLARAVAKLKQRIRPTGSVAAVALAPEERPQAVFLEHVLVSERDVMRPVPLDHVIYFEARDKGTMVHTQEGEYGIDVALAALEPRLPPRKFLRTHRRHLVNVGYIVELRRLGNRQLQIILSLPTKEELVVSRRCMEDVIRRLGGLG